MVIEMIKKSVKYSYLFLLITYSTGCVNPNNLSPEENFILEVYNEDLVTYEQHDPQTTLESLCLGVEEYLLEEKMLESISRSSYKTFLDSYVLGNSLIDFDSLHSTNIHVQSLNLSLNIGRGWYAFNEAIKKFNESIAPNSSVRNVHNVLTRLWSEKFESEEILNDYLDGINEIDFINKVIYRMPLLVYSYNSLQDRINNKISVAIENYRKAIHADTLFSEEDLNAIPTTPE